MTRTARFLVPALLVWASASSITFAGMAATRGLHDPVSTVLLGLVAAVVGTVLLGGVRTLLMVCAYPILSRRVNRQVIDQTIPQTKRLALGRSHGSAADGGTPSSRVALLYCTADDFSADALDRSRAQTHSDVTTVILDDSTDETIRVGIDAYAARTGAEVVRRERRTGFKAGNLNHFFDIERSRDFDHFAVVDSDEVLDSTFVAHALARFADDPSTGVVQGRHRAHAGGTAFSNEFGAMLETHVRVTQLARSTFGFSMFMGRGALVSAACIRATGGFPELVTEDVAFSLEARRAGFRIVYAADIVSSEDFPVDYQAFKKQHGKFVEGAVELLRTYGRSIVSSRLGVGEKVDLLLEHSMVPLGAFLGVLLFVMGLLPGGDSGLFPLWIAACLAVSGVTALVPETLRRLVHRGPRAAGAFLARALALYASMLWVTLRSTARVVVGRRATFTITPKRRSASRWRGTFIAEAVVLAIALVISIAVTGSMAPAGAAAVAAAGALYLTRFSARRMPAESDARRMPAESAARRMPAEIAA